MTRDIGRARGPLIKRWIGMARRRADRRRPVAAAAEDAQIITLTWEQTFGRPPRTTGTERGGQAAVVLLLRSCA